MQVHRWQDGKIVYATYRVWDEAAFAYQDIFARFNGRGDTREVEAMHCPPLCIVISVRVL